MTTPPKDYAVAVIVETPQGIPLVCDPQKPVPHFWKFPGGRSNSGEIPEETALRELREETSIRLEKDALKLLHQEARGGHSFFLFQAHIPATVGLPSHGSDGELVKFFSHEEIQTMPDFFPNHRALAERFLFATT